MTGRTWAVACLVVACSSAPPPRTSFAQYPGAPADRDLQHSDPVAVAIADRVFAAAGGAEAWNRAREILWTQTVEVDPDAASAAPSKARKLETRNLGTLKPGVHHYWDRWNGRYAVRTERASIDTIFVFDVYGTRHVAFGEDTQGQPLLLHPLDEGPGGARAMWHTHTALIGLPFLLHEPGARLADGGPSFGENGELHHLVLRFAAADPRRGGTVLDIVVDADAIIQRVTIETPATHLRAIYDLSDWVTVAGLSIATTRIEPATGTVTRISDLAVREVVDNDDFFVPE